MPFEKGNLYSKNGKGGRSRKVDEEKRDKLISNCTDFLTAQMNDPNVEVKAKRDIALRVVVKSIPQDVMSGGEKLDFRNRDEIETRVTDKLIQLFKAKNELTIKTEGEH